jgi:hypothetical protein
MAKSCFFLRISSGVFIFLSLILMASLAIADAPEPTTLPAPDNLDSLRATFAARNSPENLAQLGRSFFGLTFLGDWDPQEFNRPARWAQLKEVRAAIDANDYPKALDLFKRYSLQKLRTLDDYGISKTRFDPYSGGPVGWKWVHPLFDDSQRKPLIAQADDLMKGIVASSNGRVQIGEPGEVNWKAAADQAKQNWGSNWPWHLDAFSPLLAAYLFTGDHAYLDRWSAYADDWALNQNYGAAAATVTQMPDQWAGGCETTITFLRYMNGIAMLPGGEDVVPAATFARVMSRMIKDYIPITVMYHRANANGWTELSTITEVDLGFYLDEYHCAPLLFRDAFFKFELITPYRHLPDGSDIDSTVGYGFQYIWGGGSFLDRLKFRHVRLPDWQLAAWEKKDLRTNFRIDTWEHDVRDEMDSRMRMMTGHLTSNGEWPIGGSRNGHEPGRARETYDNAIYFTPEIFRIPDMSDILSLGVGDLDATPSFMSDWLPYSGHYYIRSGWKRTDPYLYMYCAPHPAGGQLSSRNNNAIGVGGYGHDLIETGENGTYDTPRSPVRVDGLEQYFHAGIPSWGHRGLLTAWHEPAELRWHDSPFFTVAEGVYAGNYGRPKGVTDVVHQRMVEYVRSGDLWIVTDRLSSPALHEYTLDWYFPIPPGKGDEFQPEQVVLNAAAETIKTSRPGPGNVSLYHFPSTPLAFTDDQHRSPEENHYRTHDFLRLSGDWKAQGESVVVTAIYPREAVEKDLHEIKALAQGGATGFSAVTPDGTQVQYAASIKAPASLKLGNFTATAESLLLSKGTDGSLHGVALGCIALAMNSHAVKLPVKDVEFSVKDGHVSTVPIRKPIEPVAISPNDTDAFLGEQKITLTCATPGTIIHYTTDGVDPTLQSPVYDGPITLKESAEVKARAVMPGLETLPVTLDGTEATIVTKARFRATKLSPVATAAATVPGLHYDYFTGRWQDLLMSLDTMKPASSGHADNLFDLTAKGDAKTFGFRYTGYLEVPEDGVYTFYAPPETYRINLASGYELNIWIDGDIWHPGTALHALGTWSIALAKGKHSILVSYADLRGEGFNNINTPGLAPLTWDGTAPVLEFSGPGVTKAPLPASLLSCDSNAASSK